MGIVKLAKTCQNKMDALRSRYLSSRWLITITAMLLIVIAGAWLSVIKITPDSDQYVLMAQGRIGEVERPFAPRVLHPFLARVLTFGAWLSLDQSFALLALLSLGVFVAFLLLIFPIDLPQQPLWLFVILFTPALLNLFRSIYIHDLFYAGLLAALFVALKQHRRAWVLGLLALLFLTRESTYLLAACLMVLAWRWHEREIAIGSAEIILIGLFFASLLSGMAKPSLHGLNPLLYTVSRIPINFVWNVLGVPLLANTSEAFWRETNPAVLEFCAVPAAILQMPTWLPTGGIRTVKICGVFIENPLNTLALMLTTFGVAPALLLAGLRAQPFSSLWKSLPLFAQLAWVYGIISFAIAPMLGNTVGRYVAYAWPLFWVLLPHLYSGNNTLAPIDIPPKIGALCHIILLAMGLLLTQWALSATWLMIIVVGAAAAHFFVYRATVASSQ